MPRHSRTWARRAATVTTAAALVVAPVLSTAAAPEPLQRTGAEGVALVGAVTALDSDAADDATVALGGTEVPDPLVLDNGDVVDSVDTWENERRPELLAAFEDHVYGQTLPTPDDITFDEGGSGAAKTITITVAGPEGAASFDLRLFVPDTGTPKGTFLLIDHRGSVGDDPSSSGYAPVDQILQEGYAFAALDAGQVAPDDPGSYRSGVIDAFFPAEQELPAAAGRTISAWAWGASRAMDYLETDPDIDPERVAVIGHSRGGKAALWAGARDTRFPVVL